MEIYMLMLVLEQKDTLLLPELQIKTEYVIHLNLNQNHQLQQAFKQGRFNARAVF